MRKRAATAGAASAPPDSTELALRALPWLAAAVAAAPLVLSGFPRGHDFSFELLRVAEYRSALAAGQLPPWWAENLYGGYGSPVFLFYAPLFSAAASLASALCGSIPTGSALLLAVITFASLPFIRVFLGELLASAGLRDPAAARLGTVFWLLDPYLLTDKLVRNADAEYLALCLAPIALAGVARAAREPRTSFALVSGGVALVVLAHNLTALVVVALALGLAMVLYARGPRSAWTATLSGVAAGLALSAFFWLPALVLTPEVRTEELVRGKFDYRRQFQALDSLFGYARFFAVGWATPAVLAAGALAAIRLPGRRALVASLLVLSLWLAFLETGASEAIWAAVPGLPLFQFPWRMMGPLALAASALVTLVAASALAGRSRALRAFAEAGVAGLLLLNALPRLLQVQALTPEESARLQSSFAPEVVRQSGASVTVGDEYLPRAAEPELWKRERPIDGPVAAVASGAVRWDTLVDRGSHVELATHADGPARLWLARFAFPGWHVELDGKPVQATASPRGALQIDVPAGDARVDARLEPPFARRAALAFSGLALAAWAALLFATRRRAAGSGASQR